MALIIILFVKALGVETDVTSSQSSQIKLNFVDYEIK